jgi:hypothetical protein
VLTVQSVRMLTWQAVRHVAGSYDTWQATMWTVGGEWDDDTWHYQGEWFGATWPRHGLPRGTLLLVGCIKFIWSPPDSTP